jgi:MATE family multidrug resistance protein
MTQPKASLAEGGWAELLKLAWPFIVSNSVWMLQLLFDRVLLSRYGTLAVGAAMASGILFWVPLSLFQGTAGYVTTFVAQYVGAGQLRRVGPVMWQALLFSILSGVAFLALVPFAPVVVALGGHERQLQILEVDFLQCLALSGVPALITASIGGFFAGRGSSRVFMVINVTGMAVYGVLASLLIFGNARLHVPALGIVGAGLASVGGSCTSALLGLVLFLRPHYEEVYATRSGWRFDRALFGRLLRFGVPNGLGAALDPLIFSFFTQLVGRLGPVELAATSVTFTLNLLLILPALGIGQAVEVLVGQRLGENRPGVAARSTWTALRLDLAFTAVAALAFLAVPGPLVALFGGEAGGGEARRQVAELVPILLRFVVIYALFDTMNVVFSFALRGAGDTRFVTLVALVFSWPVMVLPTWWAVEELKSEPVPHARLYLCWTAASAYVILLALTFLFRFVQGRWRTMRVIEHAPGPATEPGTNGDYPVTDRVDPFIRADTERAVADHHGRGG